MQTDTSENKELRKMLYVDDDLEMPTLVKIALKKLVTLTDIKYLTSGKMALKILEKYQPDLILLDVMMPEMDGREVIKRLKNNPKTKTIPVIFLTAEPTSKFNSLLDIGAVDVICKPFDVKTLAGKIQNIWSKLQ